MESSKHPVVIEYAVRECFLRKTPKTAAVSTAKKLAGSSNLFIGGGSEIVEIDTQELENQIWLRMAANVIAAESHMKPGCHRYAVEGTLQKFGQKITVKNVEQLETAVRFIQQLV